MRDNYLNRSRAGASIEVAGVGTKGTLAESERDLPQISARWDFIILLSSSSQLVAWESAFAL